MPKPLTPTQRKFLRGLANTLDCEVRLGKGGASAQAVGHVRSLLERRELIKIRLLPAAGKERQALAEAIASAAGAELAGVVGRVAVLYRPDPQLPPGQRIQLPE